MVVNWLCGLYRLEAFNEKWDNMVRWVKVAEKEKDILEVSKMLQTCNIFAEDDLIL
jgi:hypothetical protein